MAQGKGKGTEGEVPPGMTIQELERAAEAGDVPAMKMLGLLLHRSNPAVAERWDRRAAEGGDLVAMYNLGVLLQGRGAKREARRWWKQSAEQGHPASMRALARLLRYRRPRTAKRWLNKAAAEGDAIAMVRLALAQWRHGIGLSPPESAEVMMRRAADTGLGRAMWFLALWAHQRGNEGECQEWLHAGADRDDEVCTRALEFGVNLANVRTLLRLANRVPEVLPGPITSPAEHLPD